MIELGEQVRKAMFPMILVFIVIVALLGISFYYLYSAYQAYTSGLLNDALYYALLSVGGIGITTYITYLIRKRTLSKKPEPRIVTSIECKKCEFKNLRKFEKGDYVFKTIDTCQKCNEPMIITGIYAETQERE